MTLRELNFLNATPSALMELLASWFDFPNQLFFCQVGTVFNDRPHLRTMTLYDITHDNKLVFLSRTDTNKWRHILANSQVSVLVHNPSKGQVVIEGHAVIETDLHCLKFYWNKMQTQTQAIYTTNTDHFLDGIPSCFGIMKIKPIAFDVLCIDQQNYLRSERTITYLTSTGWQQETAPVS
jgi:uncharacterized pyridoxamine 5'-phosphate oxidase family protein